jgi:hypothetical protein
MHTYHRINWTFLNRSGQLHAQHHQGVKRNFRECEGPAQPSQLRAAEPTNGHAPMTLYPGSRSSTTVTSRYDLKPHSSMRFKCIAGVWEGSGQKRAPKSCFLWRVGDVVCRTRFHPNQRKYYPSAVSVSSRNAHTGTNPKQTLLDSVVSFPLLTKQAILTSRTSEGGGWCQPTSTNNEKELNGAHHTTQTPITFSNTLGYFHFKYPGGGRCFRTAFKSSTASFFTTRMSRERSWIRPA